MHNPLSHCALMVVVVVVVVKQWIFYDKSSCLGEFKCTVHAPGLKKELLGGGGGGGGAGTAFFFFGGGFLTSGGFLQASDSLIASAQPNCCLKNELAGCSGNGAGPAFFGGI